MQLRINMKNKNNQKNPATENNLRTDKRKSERGSSMIEMIIAISLLTVGLFGTAAAISYSFSHTYATRNATASKLLIVSSLEEIENLRNTEKLTFIQIANVGSVNDAGATVPFSGFPTTFRNVSSKPGQDGVFGTADDFIEPGPDTVYGTADDVTNNGLARPLYSRRITITSLTTYLKKVEVTIRYAGGQNGTISELTGISYVNDNTRSSAVN